MPFKCFWYVEGYVLYGAMWGKATVPDTLAMVKMTEELIAQVPDRSVHMVINLSGLTQPLPLKDTITIFNQVKPPRRQGWYINIGAKTTLLRLLGNLGLQLMRLRHSSFENLAQAVAFLSKIDPTIPWEQADQTTLEQLEKLLQQVERE